MSTRRCPRCTFTLVPHRPPQGMSAVEVDVCPRCHGSFLDPGDAKATLGENAEPATWERSSSARFQGKGRLKCPAGHGALNVYRLEAPPTSGTDVEVDVCPTCMGMWLDAWEAARVMQATQKIVVDHKAIPESAQRTGAGWYLFQLFSGMPVEEYNPVRRKPLMVLTILLACVAVFVVEVIHPKQEWFITTFGMVPKDFLAGRNVHSVITHMFLHGGIAHIAANMWFLYTFGDNVEDRLGRFKFLIWYLLFGVAAGMTQTLMSLGGSAPLIGASGAIAGLMGAYLMLFPKTRVWQVILFVRFRVPVWVYLGFWVLLQAVLGYASWARHDSGGVAWWAHLGGFGAGALWGLFARGKYGDGAELRR